MLSVSTTFFDRCTSAMMQVLRDNGLTHEFMNYCPHPEDGYMYTSNPMITRLSNLVSGGHSDPPFALCCRFVKDRLLEKRMHRARFKGIVRAIVVLRRLRISATEITYTPPMGGDGGGCGYVAAAEEFVSRVTNSCTASGLPPVPSESVSPRHRRPPVPQEAK
jgi:hypothetical protein